MKQNVLLMGLALMALAGCGCFSGSVSKIPARSTGPENPQAWEKTAREEFDLWFPQVAEGSRVLVDGLDGVVFHIGDTDFAKGRGLSSASFKDEEWCVRSFGRDVILNGGGSRGALYAVYHFLEDDCGIRWWNEGDCDVPAAKPLSLPALDRRGRPFFRYRDIYRDYGRVPEPQTSVRLRLNGNGPGHIPLALGGGIEYGPPYLTHTFGRYLPFEKYGKEHPEWYAWHKKDGKRDGGMFTGQFCLSNKELLKVLTEKVKSAVKEGEAKSRRLGLAKPKIYALVQNDSKYPCECDACLAEVAKCGYSGQMVRFVNAIAAEVGKDHPDILFKTSSYLYTEAPPKDDTRAADNILLDIATTTDNLAGPVDDPGCAIVRRNVKGWASHAKNLFIWTYAVTFEKSTIGWPFPSEYHLPGKIRFLADKGALVYFAEQEHSQTADLYELKLYLQRKLAEDPYADADALRADFMNRYYGSAGKEVAAARALLEENRRATSAKVSWFPRRNEFAWITDATIEGMRTHFDAAERLVANDEKRLKRVRVARQSADRVYESRRHFRACAGRYPLKDFYLHDAKNMAVASNGVLHIKADAPAFSRENLFKAGVSGMKSGVTLRPEGDEREGEWTWYSADLKGLPNGYYYFCNWQAQLATGLPEQVGKSVRLRLQARLTGPTYYPGSKRQNIAEIGAFEVCDFGSVRAAFLPSSARLTERTAANELATWFPPQTKTDFRFHVGDTDLAKEKGLSSAGLKDEEWVVKSFGRDVVLNGGGSRGVLYAVYHFLEDVCGVRWWMDDEFDVPETVVLPATLDLRGRPFFHYREVYRDAESSPWTAARCRINANGPHSMPAALGGNFKYGSPYHTHTWDRILPWDKYGKTHPEWYSLEKGQRVGGIMRAQMCLSCPDLVGEFAKRVRENVRADREKAAKEGVPAPSVYDLSMNDNQHFCECTACSNEVAAVGHSGQQLRFVNAIAREVSKTYPDLLFSTAAYLYSEPAPKGGVKPDANVVVKLCNTRQNVAQPMTHSDNAFMFGQVKDWSKVTDRLFIWEYFTTFGKTAIGFPYPSERVIPDNLRFYADHGAKGFLIEHERPDRADWYDLKFYLERRLLEDPYQDGRVLTDEFYARYLGPSAPAVRAARDYLAEIYDARKVDLKWFAMPADFFWIRAADLDRIFGFFKEAEAAAKGDAKILRRVAKARLGFDLLAEDRRHLSTWLPPKKGVAERPYIEFLPDAKKWIFYSGSDAKVVDDPKSPNGKSVRLPANSKRGFEFPIQFGCALSGKQTGAPTAYVKNDPGFGEHWVETNPFVFPENFAYFYFTWFIQLHVNSADLIGQRMRLKVHVRFERNAAYVDRFVLEQAE